MIVTSDAIAGPDSTRSTEPSRPADFGQQYVRNNPFTLTALACGDTYGGPPFDVNKYLGAGLNLVWSHNERSVAQAASEAAMPWFVTSDDYEFIRQKYTALPHARGVYVWDEPQNPEQMELAAERVRNMNKNLPKLMAYVTALSHPAAYATYDEYLDAIVHIVKPDVLMWDLYPFDSDGTTKHNTWFSFLMAVRNKALANKLPYWAWLQSYTGVVRRTPSESDTRYNAFTLLTAGYTGFSYWVWDRVGPIDQQHGDQHGGLFLDTSGNPTEFYHYAAASNREIANLGQSLRMLTSTDVRFVPGRHSSIGPSWDNSAPAGMIAMENDLARSLACLLENSAPTGLTPWGAWGSDPVANPHIRSVTVDIARAGHIGLNKNGLIGFFTDDDGGQYFMLTSLYQGPGLSADAAELTFVVAFDDGVDNIWRLNRETGIVEEISLDNHTLFLTLPGGTGDLFKYDNGDFAGVDLKPDAASRAARTTAFR